MALATAALLAAMPGDDAQARTQLEASIALFDTIGDRRFANFVRSELAQRLRQQGNDLEALSLYREAIVIWLELGHYAAVAHQLESLALIATRQRVVLV